MPYVYAFDSQAPQAPDGAQGPARRQGRQPGRDDLGPRVCRCPLASPSRPTPAGPTWTAAGPTGLSAEVVRQRSPAGEGRWGRSWAIRRDPLLVSVRSGAKFSMPGMMDTVLNLGLNDASVKGLAEQTSDERFAYDSYRRFISMYGRIVLGIDGAAFDEPFEAAKERGRRDQRCRDPGRGPARPVPRRTRRSWRTAPAIPFPQEPDDQLTGRDRGGVPVLERGPGRGLPGP